MYAKSGNKNANLSFLQIRNKQNKQKGRPADPTSACLKSKEREKFLSTDWST